ncbi:hypothetical protein [Ruminococcus sp. AM42-11]|uniref:hypothetical protein n=1 Tax=Ruminococcus sp. AM42-11 TaxID=2292372 RepID=UPI001FAAE352|nr:hypothetical protein [Ruminococcus sp. AM42-11]
MRKRLVSLLFAGIMACSVIGSGVTTFAAENDSHINLALFTYIEAWILQQTGADGILHAVV